MFSLGIPTSFILFCLRGYELLLILSVFWKGKINKGEQQNTIISTGGLRVLCSYITAANSYNYDLVMFWSLSYSFQKGSLPPPTPCPRDLVFPRPMTLFPGEFVLELEFEEEVAWLQNLLQS